MRLTNILIHCFTTTNLQNSIFRIEKPVLIVSFIDYWCKNYFTIRFGATLMHKKNFMNLPSVKSCYDLKKTKI